MYVWLAVDMWSAGMILLFFLAGKFPLFQSNDDVEALLEIACIIGRRRMEKAATLHCERLPEARTVPYY
jgi:cell division control protein 7